VDSSTGTAVMMEIARGLKELVETGNLHILDVDLVCYFGLNKCVYQALKYRSVTDIVRPIREIVRRRKETTGHSVRPK
jgi:hypothetical protein